MHYYTANLQLWAEQLPGKKFGRYQSSKYKQGEISDEAIDTYMINGYWAIAGHVWSDARRTNSIFKIDRCY